MTLTEIKGLPSNKIMSFRINIYYTKRLLGCKITNVFDTKPLLFILILSQKNRFHQCFIRMKYERNTVDLTPTLNSVLLVSVGFCENCESAVWLN